MPAGWRVAAETQPPSRTLACRCALRPAFSRNGRTISPMSIKLTDRCQSSSQPSPTVTPRSAAAGSAERPGTLTKQSTRVQGGRRSWIGDARIDWEIGGEGWGTIGELFGDGWLDGSGWKLTVRAVDGGGQCVQVAVAQVGVLTVFEEMSGPDEEITAPAAISDKALILFDARRGIRTPTPFGFGF